MSLVMMVMAIIKFLNDTNSCWEFYHGIKLSIIAFLRCCGIVSSWTLLRYKFLDISYSTFQISMQFYLSLSYLVEWFWTAINKCNIMLYSSNKIKQNTLKSVKLHILFLWFLVPWDWVKSVGIMFLILIEFLVLQ